MVREEENDPARSGYAGENAALIPEVRREVQDWFKVKGQTRSNNHLFI